jgi:arabinofuranosyltransferase
MTSPRLDSRALRRLGPRAAALLALTVFAVVVLANAWVSDDAYICLRTVDNFVHGFGLTWNPGERVQTFTCPLWVLVLAAAYRVTGEVFVTTLAVSTTLAVATAAVLAFGVARSTRHALVVVLVLVLSKASVDYATSGLENALGHLLLALFVLEYGKDAHGIVVRRDETRRRVVLGLLAGLAAVNRMDTVLLLAPALALVLFEARTAQARVAAVAALVAGAAPFFAWEAFAVSYYGFPFPNITYATIGTGIPAIESIVQGARYALESARVDPITLATIVAAGAVAFAAPADRGGRRARALALGTLVYVLYVVRVGGDFMSGRFFAAPLVTALGVLARAEIPQRAWRPAFTAALVFGFVGGRSPLLTGWTDGSRVAASRSLDHGIADEAAVSRATAGLVAPGLRLRREPEHPAVADGQRARSTGVRLTVQESVGYFGFYSGPSVFVVDPLALTDPLLARMPARYDPHWRIGHFARALPEGYLPTLASGEDRLADRDLARMYRAIEHVTRGPLFTVERWSAIGRLNTGGFAHRVDFARYRSGAVAYDRSLETHDAS